MFEDTLTMRFNGACRMGDGQTCRPRLLPGPGFSGGGEEGDGRRTEETKQDLLGDVSTSAKSCDSV